MFLEWRVEKSLGASIGLSATLRSMIGAAFLGREKRFRTLIIWNRDRGQLSKASHYQVTAEGAVATLGRGSRSGVSCPVTEACGKVKISAALYSLNKKYTIEFSKPNRLPPFCAAGRQAILRSIPEMSVVPAINVDMRSAFCR